MNRDWNRRVKFIMIAFMVAHSANDGFNAMFPPLLPMIREHFDLNYTQLGGFLSIFRFLGNYLQFSIGYLAYFIPSPTLMVTGLFWISTGVLIATFANTYWSMATALSFAGIGRATYHPLSFSLLSRIFRKEILGRVTGLHMGAQSAAYLITPFLVILFAKRFGWRWPLRIWSVYGIVAAIFLLIVFRKNMDTAEKVKGKVFSLPFVSSSLVLYLLFHVGWSISRNGINTFLPLYLVEKGHFSIKFATFCYMSQFIIEMFARPLVGAFSDKIGKRKPLIIIESFLCAVLFLGLTIFREKWQLVANILAIGLFAGTMPVVSRAFSIELIPAKEREKTLGFVFTMNMASATFAPLIIGFIADYFGLLQSFLILTLIVVISTSLLFFAKEK